MPGASPASDVGVEVYGRGSPGTEIVHHDTVAERHALGCVWWGPGPAHDGPGHVERIGPGHDSCSPLGARAMHL